MVLVLVLAIIALVLISSFFSGAETSMMSLNRYRLRHLAKKHYGARLAQRLLKRPDRLLGIVLIGNTFANILASALATVLLSHLFGDLGIALGTVFLTLFVLLFAETLPKTFAAMHPEKFAFPAAFILTPLLKITYPVIWLLNAIVNNVLKCFGFHVKEKKAEALTLDELKQVVHASGEGLPTHKDMLLGVLDLEHATVKDAMIPRQNVTGIDLNASDKEISELIKHSPFSKLPVYRDNLDNILGIIDLRKLISVGQPKNFKDQLTRAMMPPYFVPETTSLKKQLIHFQQSSKKMALVVDEYGDFEGLVTVQDVLEEIVGKFTHEPIHTRSIQAKGDGSYVVDAGMTIRDVNRMLTLDFPTHGPKTLSGLIIEHLETLPSPHVSLLISGHPVEILKVVDNAVKMARIYPKPPEAISLHTAE